MCPDAQAEGLPHLRPREGVKYAFSVRSRFRISRGGAPLAPGYGGAAPLALNGADWRGLARMAVACIGHRNILGAYCRQNVKTPDKPRSAPEGSWRTACSRSDEARVRAWEAAASKSSRAHCRITDPATSVWSPEAIATTQRPRRANPESSPRREPHRGLPWPMRSRLSGPDQSGNPKKENGRGS